MNKKPNKQAELGRIKDPNSLHVAGTKNELTFPAPQKKRRRTIIHSSPDMADAQGMEELEWRMGL